MPHKTKYIKTFGVEYAVSGRSHCHKCSELIKKGELRISRVVPAITFDGAIDVWYHPKCMFAETWQHPTYVEQIEGMENLHQSDASKIQRLVKLFGATEHIYSEAHEGLCCEYARSSKSECRGCYETIEKDDLRLGLLVEPPEESPFKSVVPEWHHPYCFFNRPDYDTLGVENVDQFAGSNLLDEEDRNFITELIDMKHNREKIPGRKRVERAWEMKAKGLITPKRSMKRLKRVQY
jgi:Poly(ADP-ribose) polymerase and DNA-Ligase Zn-finger region